MKVRVTVMLKDGVLDPQGKAVEHALHVLDFKNVGDVRIGRVIDLELSESDPARAIVQANEMARALLANLVIEDFAAEVVEE
ncbi:phosphoribosylformylglycinamidine synthase subunit PurS [Gluconacetobacter entanii]|uniref:Phosphoribosylformylglycinamidine synthase subunit PurS n=2 Tax=Acetobacteraceae TaxID=433 RepID=A0A2S3W5X1_9PROT|nr:MULTISPECIES: phosphoribosylformylglycinamidine synthase subunit PurS [Acetobacteraceae]MBE7619009.1 phosphoribosylformylglycinamidine synthase subunit PurS [Komagataeibacter sp. FXV2]MCE2577603.1 phosphoribosylformylglycinamidine synthase subunit PurS [Komagataeibacter sp. FNDCR1]MBY4641015.1 phosphoribosylformylglycinamidine synthase subunit PurS [Gluconacetobacter entanii]MCW4581021.1 phosphoribosylformylglycinamidine synthase subunit PurS [Gluconacetobacter entanii]MCW4584310.1 phosphor